MIVHRFLKKKKEMSNILSHSSSTKFPYLVFILSSVWWRQDPKQYQKYTSHRFLCKWIVLYGSKGIVLRLTKRVVASSDIRQIEGHCWPLMLLLGQAIRCQENENCCNNSWLIETYLGISTCMYEPLFPQAIKVCAILFLSFSDSSLFIKWELPFPLLLEKHEVGTEKYPTQHQMLRWDGKKIILSYWESCLFLRLFTTTVYFSWTYLSLNFLKWSRKENIAGDNTPPHS